MADFLPVIIQELDPPFRSLPLGGRNRPKPIKVGGEQKAIQTWYPGTTKASVQVMGTREDPIIMEGRWDDPAGTLNPVQGSRVRIATARGLMVGQNLCQLLWGTTIVRQGRLARFEVLYQRTNRVEYRIVFEVDQANEAVALWPLPILNLDATALITAMAAAAATASLVVSVADSASDIGGTA